jgi:membrane-associated protease RseP (regulator of RpoE activity)
MIMCNGVYGVYCAVPRTLTKWGEVRLMHIAICAAVLVCGGALPTKARPPGPSAQHLRNRPVFCPWIGVTVSPMTQAFADSLGMAQPYVAIFVQPKPHSPVAQAGIEAGDVLTMINRRTLRRSRDFAAIISKMAPGAVVDLTTYRNRELMDRQVTLAHSKCARRTGAHRNSKT